MITRSRNNNIFHFSSYFRSWSRILFHDHGGRGMEAMRRQYDIPKHIKTIEVDLIPSSSHEIERFSQINIRCHCTSLAGHPDKYQGSLDDKLVEIMLDNFSPKAVNTMLHANLLPLIDFDEYDYKIRANGGAPLSKILKGPISLHEYWAQQVLNGGGPGLLMQDVEQDWQKYCGYYNKQIELLLP